MTDIRNLIPDLRYVLAAKIVLFFLEEFVLALPLYLAERQ